MQHIFDTARKRHVRTQEPLVWKPFQIISTYSVSLS